MKLSFAYTNSMGGFLSVATVATLLLSHPIGAIAKIPQNLADIAVLIPRQLDSVLRDTSEKRLVNGCNHIFFCRETDFLGISSEPPPPPEVPERSGGSR
jgi:hypothetical protein